jgi:uncharacterized protein DUF4115
MRARPAALRGTPRSMQRNIAGDCAECNANQGSGRVEANTERVATLNRHRLSDILFWVVAGVSALLLVALALVVAGAIPIDPASAPAVTSEEGLEESPAKTRSTERAATTERATTPATTTSRPVEPTVVVLTAVRGDSWFSARVGSENGKVLDERVLAQGESVQLRGRRIWLSVGAAGNVEVTVDGKPRELSPGTVSLVLTPSI